MKQTEKMTQDQTVTLELIIAKATEIEELLKILATTEDPWYFGLPAYRLTGFLYDCESVLEQQKQL